MKVDIAVTRSRRVTRGLVRLVLACFAMACGAARSPAALPPPRTALPARMSASKTRDAMREQRQVVEGDTTRVTAGGVRYTAPAGWEVTTRDRIVIVTAPEGDLHL